MVEVKKHFRSYKHANMPCSSHERSIERNLHWI